MKLLLQEWSQCYEALIKGKKPNLPELPIQYADFALWQRDWMQGPLLQEQLGYWKEQLKGPLPTLELPTNHSRAAAPSSKGALYMTHFGKGMLERLSELCRAEDATLFMGLLAGFNTLLHRYTGQEDILVGSPIAGRTRVETEQLIGFFVNTLALRSRIEPGMTFRQLVRQVRETTLGAYAHQDIPFEKVVEAVHPNRNAGHVPLVQTVFTLNNEIAGEDVFPGLKAEQIEVDSGTAKFDLTVVTRQTKDGLAVFAEYKTDLFHHEAIERLMLHWKNLLERAAANPDLPLDEIPLLSREEEKCIAQEWNAPATHYPRHECVHQLFETQVARTPDAIAAEYEGEQITYRELNARANQLAHRLQKLKAGPNTLMGVYMERSIEMLVAFVGILKSGGAYVPLDLCYPKERLAFMVEDTRMPVLLTQEKLARELPGNVPKVICIDSEWSSISEEPRQLPPNRALAESLAYVIYTSGSTGQPKGVPVPHRGIVRLVKNTNYIEIFESDRIAQASNASFDAATFEIWGALLNGGRVVGISKDTALSPNDFARQLREQNITTLFLTTALFNQMARETPGVFHTLRTVLFGGEAVDPKWVRSVLAYHPPRRLLHVYGPTESTTFTSWHLVESVPEDATTVPIGKPISNTELYVLDKKLRPVPVGVTGEVYVGGDGLSVGYWNRPELTAEKFVPHPFSNSTEAKLYKTGDLGRFDEKGNLEFIGRVDHQVKIRGLRIELGEIESVLFKHPQVSNCVVVAREDRPGDKRLAAYIVPGPKGAPAVSELRGYLKTHLPEFMVPAAFVFMDALPLTPNEKVDRKAMPIPDENRELEKTFVAPRDGTEQQLAKIWEKVLGVQPIGVADNFFELGGHSLLAVKLFSQIEKLFMKKLPLATLFRAPTIEQFAKLLGEENPSRAWSTMVDIQPKGSRPPMFWVHSLGGDGGGGFFYYRKLAELLGPDQPSFGIRSPQEPFDRIEQMASFYIKEIREFQAHGPYFLGGFCFGGNVAYEMAQQLTAAGEEVALLVLLESSPPNVHHRQQTWSATNARHSLENLVENVKGFVQTSPEERKEFIKKKGRKLKEKLQARIGHSEKPRENLRLDDVLDLTNYPRDYVKYAQTHWQALLHYHPKPYSGHIHLFRARKQGLSNFNHNLGWDKLVDDRVIVNIIPGTHETMLQEPNVQNLAGILRGLLDDALENRPGKEELESTLAEAV
jgi:amino acid adenylation domain-containing protein